MLEHIQDVRHIIDRMDLPPRVEKLIAKIEEDTGPLDKLDETTALEMRQVLQLVGGETLCAAIVCRLLEKMPAEKKPRPSPHPQDRIRSQEDRWNAAAAKQDGLTLLQVDDNYLAFGDQAHRISEAAGVHTHRIGRTDCISLPMMSQPDWVAKIQQANLDVALVCEVTDGYDTINVLELGGEPQGRQEDTETPA
jgi:hypothetical protein